MRYGSVESIPKASRSRALSLCVACILCLSVPAFSSAGESVKDLIKAAAKHTRAGELTRAEEILLRAIALDGKNSAPKVELAFVLTKQRRLAEAYNLVFPIARDEPKNGRAFSVLGTTMLAGGRFSDARMLFFNAIKLDQRQHLAWAGYGMLDFYENRIFDSLANLQEAIFYAPREPDYLFSLAQISSRAERYTEAAEAYKDFLHVSSRTDADRRARIKGLISFLRFLGQTRGLYVSTGKDQTTVPVELVGNRPIITVRVNGNSTPLRFVLDTGSGISVISEDTAKRLKIRAVTKGGHARGIGGDGKFEIVYGLLREIDIGDVELRHVPVYIRKFHTEGHPVDGYIGLALISKFLTTIDYGEKSFSLTRKEPARGDVRDAAADLALPLRLTSSGFLSGEVMLEGVESPLNFIVDTGASVSVISTEMAKEDPISSFANEERLRVIGSAGVTNNVQTFNLPKVTFGKHSRRDITAVALDLDLINEASGFEQAGILGGNFLRNYRLTFDFKNSRVTFVAINSEHQ